MKFFGPLAIALILNGSTAFAEDIEDVRSLQTAISEEIATQPTGEIKVKSWRLSDADRDALETHQFEDALCGKEVACKQTRTPRPRKISRTRKVIEGVVGFTLCGLASNRRGRSCTYDRSD